MSAHNSVLSVVDTIFRNLYYYLIFGLRDLYLICPYNKTAQREKGLVLSF